MRRNTRLDDLRELPRWEILLVTIFLAVLCASLYRYDAGGRMNDDRYPEYAEFIRDHWRRSGTILRYAGYPFFLAVLAKIGDGDVYNSGIAFQKLVAFSLVVTLWALVRRRFGMFAGFALLWIFATRNYLLSFTCYLLTDFLFALLWLGILVLFFKELSTRSFSVLRIVGVMLILFVSQSFRPNSAHIFFLLLASAIFVFGLTMYWRWEFLPVSLREFVTKSLLMAAIIPVVLLSSAKLFDPDGRIHAYFFDLNIKTRYVLLLPPYSEDPVDQRIEAIKKQAEREMGLGFRDVVYTRKRMQTHIARFTPGGEITQEDVDQVWKGRFYHGFGLAVYESVRVILLGHQRLAMCYYPIWPVTRPPYDYPNRDGTLKGRLFFTFGIDLVYTPAKSGRARALTDLTITLTQYILLVISLCVGIRRMLATSPFPTLVLIMAFGLNLMYIGVGPGTLVDARYTLQFAIPIYCTVALGLGDISQCLWGHVQSRAAPRLG